MSNVLSLNVHNFPGRLRNAVLAAIVMISSPRAFRELLESLEFMFLSIERKGFEVN